ncbi:MAG: tRNA (adenosine(37)-N6)-threonylcarbamoyltransferase complex transferase subunit TsaD [Candidatus Margulisbacteria bacterium]|nr:tRNA (adenosine(37)-N6)-threonylcarbamoyltransferase complex transferase subunit TsaD [Candidatus Margulisiibacteriota bacterium]
MNILAIETSCDETSAAVVKDGCKILSNIIATQVEFHKKYGGIVPEIASRKHIEVINPIIEQALDKAKVKFKDLDAVAVTYGPGLVGSLLVGLCAAKAIAYSLDIPLVGVNHLEAHIYANFLETRHSSLVTRNRKFPFVCLLVSGGHTMLVLVKDHGEDEVLGRTRDDAAGEAFDKVARFLELGYPGGPIIDKLAKEGDPNAIKFTRPMLDQGYDFSFSGIKTAVVNLVTRNPQLETRNIAASFQQAVVDVLVAKTIRAAKEYNCKTIALAGGVSANSALRKEMETQAKNNKLKVLIPPLSLCTDNAAMVGCAGYYHLKDKKASDLNLTAVASLRLG